MPETWVFVAIAALLFAHVVLVAFVIRRTGAYSVSGVDTDELFDGSESVDLAESAGGDSRRGGTVTCQNCGVANKSEYRYCRACVSELPTGLSLRSGGPDGRSRRTI
jgi:hypothetical protein